jgi:hypothetical protein
MRSIDDCMRDVLPEIDSRFQDQAAWPLVKRNQAITARNRNMKKISDMLGMEYRELPLETPETA